MNKRGYTFSLIISAVLLGAILPAHAAKYKIKWLLGHKNLDYFEEAAVSFKNAVESGSRGAIEVTIVTLDEDKGSAPAQKTTPAIAAQVAKGEAQMGHSFTDVMGAIDPRMYVFEAPYLFRGYRHMEGVIEGPIGTQMLDDLRSHHIVGLSFTYSGGANGIATKNRPIRRPKDLKGLKVGVYGDKVNEAWITGLGAHPVPLEHGLETIIPQSRAGSLDAVVITWRNFAQAALENDFKYFNLPGSTFLVSVTYINEDFYESLPDEFQSLIMDASREAGRIERAKTIELNEDSKRLVLPKGVRPIHLTKRARKAFTKALKPAYKNSIDKILGKEFIARVKKAPGGTVHPTVPLDFASR